MDLEKIEAQLKILRDRRLALPELRDYKPQARAKTAPAMVVDTKPAEDIFAGLFTEETPNDDTGKTGSDTTTSV